MKTHDLVQGTPEWLAHRAAGFNGQPFFNASDAPAMMSCSPYKTRAALLRELHTGLTAEVDAGTQRRFDDGHRFEALARPLAEEIIGETLYAIVGSEGRYAASFDGLTLVEDTDWEHKALNDALRAILPAEGVGGPEVGAALPLLYRVQMEQQCMVSGAGRALFTASKWTDDDQLVEARHCWYLPDPALRADLIAGWQQFSADLAAYVPPAIAEPVRAEPMESLPAVSVRLDGALSVAGNLPTFAEALRAFIARIPAKPATDTDFATTEAACKALKKAEEALDAAEAGALASITDVEAMRRAVADCRKLARDTRLAAEKMVERRKTEVKESAVANARAALDAHVAGLNAELAPHRLQPLTADFAGAIKGLRSIASMQDALDTTLAQAKIAADAAARVVRANAAAYRERATGLEHLFADLGALIHKAPDDFALLVQARVDTHRANEARREAERQAAEAARIAAAEQRAREQEAARIAAEQRQQAEETAALVASIRAESRRVEWPKNPAYIRKAMGTFECMAPDWENDPREVVREAIAEGRRYLSGLLADAEAARQAAAAVAAAAAPAPATVKESLTPAAAPIPAPLLQDQSRPLTDALASKPDAMRNAREAVAAIQRADEPATLKLGVICERLGFTVTAAFLADVLHVPHRGTDKAAKLYRESDWPLICRQLQSHISAMAELYGTSDAAA